MLLEFVAPSAHREQTQSALETQLEKTWDDAIQVTDGNQTIDVRSCRALFDLGTTYEPVAPAEFSVFQDRHAQCQAAALVARAQTSKSSLVQEFSLDAQAPSRLPAELSFAVSPEDEQRVAQASALGEPWSALEEVRMLDAVSAGEARYGAPASEQRLVLIARGDFNGDDFEDVLLLSRGRLTEGSLKATRLFLLTRTSAGERTLRSLALK